MKWAVYNVATGEIQRIVMCNAEYAELQAGAGEAVVYAEEGGPDELSAYVLDGILTAYTPEQVQAKSQRPAWSSGWSNSTMSWVDPRDLAQHKEDRWTYIKTRRDQAEGSPFTWSTYTFDGDSSSQQRIQGAVQLAVLATQAQQPFSIDWTLFDNTVATLDAMAMFGVGQALATSVGTAYAIGRALRDEIAAATTQEEVEAIDWP